MTEMVTLNAAREAQQLALLAQRPEGAPRDQQQPTIQISQAGIQPDARRAPTQAEAGAQEHAQQDLAQRHDRQDHGLTGPSRARVEIRSYDTAPRAAPVGRPDIVPAAVGASASAPFNSLATSPVVNGQTQAEVEVAIARQAIQTAAFEPVASAARTVRLEAAARVVRAEAAVGRPDLQLAQSPEVQLKRFADQAAAVQGFGSGEQDVPQKFYGRGGEAVIGQFAAPEQPQKYSDKAAATQPGTTSEDGSGEVKYYDKVAQTDTDFAGGAPDEQPKSMYERAQEVAAGLGQAVDPRKTYSEVTAYGAPSLTGAVVPTPETPPANVKITA